MSCPTKSRKGFTLVELAVVIVIIGVLAAFGVPRFLKSVERSKAAEAFQYLAAVRSAQERYLAKNGRYWGGTISGTEGTMSSTTDGAETLDIVQTVPKYFTGQGADGAANTDIVVLEHHDTDTNGNAIPDWTCSLQRLASSSSYGAYIVTYDQKGYFAKGATRDPEITDEVATDIPDEISPMGQ
jgi:prepilin-type N-terminal cleavage/methylation domain-containing protein